MYRCQIIVHKVIWFTIWHWYIVQQRKQLQRPLWFRVLSNLRPAWIWRDMFDPNCNECATHYAIHTTHYRTSGRGRLWGDNIILSLFSEFVFICVSTSVIYAHDIIHIHYIEGCHNNPIHYWPAQPGDPSGIEWPLWLVSLFSVLFSLFSVCLLYFF